MWAARKALLEQRLAFAPSVRSDLSYPPGYLHGTGFRETLWVGVNPNHGGPNRTARSIGKSAVTSVTTDAPKRVVVDAEIGVDEAVACRDDHAPWHLRVRLPHVVGHVGRCLADQLEIAQRRVVDQRVGDESRLIHPSRVGQHLLGEGDHVVDIEKRHSRTPSDMHSLAFDIGPQLWTKRLVGDQVHPTPEQIFEKELHAEVA